MRIGRWPRGALPCAALAAAASAGRGAAGLSRQAHPAPSFGSRPAAAYEFLSRLIGSKLTEAWKQQVVAESRPGAAGNIAMEAVQRAKPR